MHLFVTQFLHIFCLFSMMYIVLFQKYMLLFRYKDSYWNRLKIERWDNVSYKYYSKLFLEQKPPLNFNRNFTSMTLAIQEIPLNETNLFRTVQHFFQKPQLNYLSNNDIHTKDDKHWYKKRSTSPSFICNEKIFVTILHKINWVNFPF